MVVTWPNPPADWSLRSGQAHVWAASFDLPDHQIQALSELLCPTERDQAGRFRLDHDRKAYVIAHGLLRRLLECYLKRPASKVQFNHGPHGKPHLNTPHGDLHFNIAHTRGLVLLAFCRGADIGVDVERQDRPSDHAGIVKRYFSPTEQREYAALPDPKRRIAFFNGWTRKEAILKACGRGLSIAPERVEVSLGADEPARVVCTPPEITPFGGWSLWDLRPASGYVGALALPSRDWAVRSWRCSVD